MQVSNFVWLYFKPIWRERCRSFLFMSWFRFYDKNRKIFHKFCKNHYNTRIYIWSVFEIKGAHCARRAHFRRRAHVFLSCAPGVCTFFQGIIMAVFEIKVLFCAPLGCIHIETVRT